MTPEAQRIAIGEACPRAVKKTVTVITGHGFDEEEITLDPLHDLNVMHEAEKILTHNEREWCQADEFCKQLDILIKPKYTDYFPVIHASAAHRAEAFLRATGRWTTAP